MSTKFDVKADIVQILQTEGSKHFLDTQMESITNECRLINFIHRYSVFNGNFAGGVANLAGAFHIRQDIFKNKGEAYQGCDDGSADIASYIFFAAEDEYANRDNGARVTHRGLGQFFLKCSLMHFQISPSVFNSTYALNDETIKVLAQVKQGYLLDKKNEEIELYRGLGFHIGSEILADEEFNIIDKFLRANWPDLVKYAESQKNKTGQSGYDWVRYHTFVEMEHLDNALEAVNILLRNYAGKLPVSQVYQHVLDGFLGFAKMQRFLFGNILNEDCPKSL
jgi:hypothetical protein